MGMKKFQETAVGPTGKTGVMGPTGGIQGVVGRTGVEVPTHERTNRRIENTPETFQARLERAARHVTRNAAELKGGYLVSPEDMALLRTVLESKPEAQ